MPDRRQHKLAKKRQKREQHKQRQRVRSSHQPTYIAKLIGSASRAPFGPCAINVGWDDESAPELVSLTVTRVLGDGRLLPSVALVDRTCLGVKNALVRDPVSPGSIAREFDELYASHAGGWQACEPFLAQSVLFHALEYAARLGFEPHPDFAVELFGPRPATLIQTAWCAPAKPIYVLSPYDNARTVAARLNASVGPEGYEVLSPFDGELDDDDSLDDVLADMLADANLDDDSLDDDSLDDDSLDDDSLDDEAASEALSQHDVAQRHFAHRTGGKAR